MMRMNKETQLQRGNRWLLLLLVAGSMTGYAQSENEYFTYADASKTTIDGLTDAGTAATSLTIPAAVTTVRSGAFADANKLRTLTIDGGNPTFAGSLFGTNSSTLTSINMGSRMTMANMKALLTSIGANSPLTTVTIDGYSDADASTWTGLTWSDTEMTGILTSSVSVVIPAEKVYSTQTFGNATVKGRFNIDKEIISFCTSATFEDDGNNNMLFYVADKIADDGRLHIQRVYYIGAGKGVLIHRTENSSGYCDLPRVSGTYTYSANMLVGVTEDTHIDAIDGNKTNYVLKDGAFHPTSGGTIGANKAYLQIPTAAARAETLAIVFPDEETEIKSLTPAPSPMEEGSGYYDLQGRKLDTKPTTKGIYINNGKKYIIR